MLKNHSPYVLYMIHRIFNKIKKNRVTKKKVIKKVNRRLYLMNLKGK